MRRGMTLAAALLVGALALPGCGADAQAPEVEGTTETPDGVVEELVGGWEITMDMPASKLSDEDAALVMSALNNGEKDDLGWTYSPVAILARATGDDGKTEQVGLLCKASVDDKVGWYVVTVNLTETDEDGQTMKYVVQIDPSDLKTTDTWEGVSTEDGWQVVGYDGEDGELAEDAKAAFDQVRGAFEAEGEVRVVACLATQVVAGTNYLYVVQTKPDGGIDWRYSFVVVYNDLSNAASVTENAYMDFGSYLNW